MSPLSILRFGWAGYLVTTEGGTKIVVDPYLQGAEGARSGLPESPYTVDDLAGADVVAVTPRRVRPPGNRASGGGPGHGDGRLPVAPASGYPDLIEALRRSLSAETVAKAAGRNWLRVLDAVLA